jgi:enoyl-CoA hydratase/carnithine racemase
MRANDQQVADIQADSGAGPLLATRRGAVQWLRLNRPERRNAYDEEMLEELTSALRGSHDAAAVVITGSGTSFCAGGFLGMLAEPDESALRRMFMGSLRLFDEIRQHPRPVIAAVNGSAAGGGNELVIACDLAIAAESATFGQTGPRIGSAPVLGGTNALAVMIGEKRAKEVSFLCRRYSARDALELGLVNAVVADDELEDEVERWTDELLALSPRYLEIAKISSNVWWNASRDSFTSGLGMLVQAIGSEDMLEGANAFVEKRAADFRKTAK